MVVDLQVVESQSINDPVVTLVFSSITISVLSPEGADSLRLKCAVQISYGTLEATKAANARSLNSVSSYMISLSMQSKMVLVDLFMDATNGIASLSKEYPVTEERLHF